MAFVFAPFKVVARQNLLSGIKFGVIECKCLGVGGATVSLLSKGGKTGSSCTSEKVLTEAQDLPKQRKLEALQLAVSGFEVC